MSWPRTLADAPEVGRPLLANPAAEWRPTATVRAPCCGRRCSADSVLDLRAVPGTVLRRSGRLAMDYDWLCSSCRSRMLRDRRNGWTLPRLLRAIGAPPEAVRLERARELAHERVQNAHKRGQRGRWDQEFAAALAALPEGTVEIEGTDAPVS